MNKAKELPAFFRDANGKELGKTTIPRIPGILNIDNEMTLAGRIPEGTEKIDVELENGNNIFRIIHGGRDRIIQAMRDGGIEKKENNFELITLLNDDDTTRYLFYPGSRTVIRIPKK